MHMQVFDCGLVMPLSAQFEGIANPRGKENGCSVQRPEANVTNDAGRPRWIEEIYWWPRV